MPASTSRTDHSPNHAIAWNTVSCSCMPPSASTCAAVMGTGMGTADHGCPAPHWALHSIAATRTRAAPEGRDASTALTRCKKNNWGAMHANASAAAPRSPPSARTPSQMVHR